MGPRRLPTSVISTCGPGLCYSEELDQLIGLLSRRTVTLCARALFIGISSTGSTVRDHERVRRTVWRTIGKLRWPAWPRPIISRFTELYCK